MRFLMLVVPNESFVPPATIEEDTRAWVEEADTRGIRLIGDRVVAAEESVTVHDSGDGMVSETGADASVRVAGFDVLEAESLDVVLDLLTRHPMTSHGRIEIRPIWEG